MPDVPITGPTVPTKYWHALDNGRVQCDLCPRFCKLQEGQRGLCFVRGRQDDRIVLATYGRSSGFCIDPIEKKPLNHFLPGTPVLSFGTVEKGKQADLLIVGADPTKDVANLRQVRWVVRGGAVRSIQELHALATAGAEKSGE